MVRSSILSLLVLASATAIQATTVPTCPDGHEQEATIAGKRWKLLCNKGIRALPIEGTETAATDPAQCAERCAAYDGCAHASYVYKRQSGVMGNFCQLKENAEIFDSQGMTTWYYLGEAKPTEGGDGNGSGSGGGNGDGDGGAGAGGNGDGDEEDPQNLETYTCNEHNGKRYVTGGITYELKCNTGHNGGALRNEPSTDLKACARLCAQTPECYSVDFDVSAKSCNMKKMGTETVAWSAGHAWYPTQCPATGDVETVENKKPEITSSPVKCPKDNGKIFMGSDGTWFYQQCCTDADGAVLLNYATVSSHNECSEACVKDKACKSFMFVPDMVPTEGTANCRLYKDGNFSTSKVDGAHYAFVVDPPTTEPVISEAKRCATTCPEADGQLYATPSGENYLMTCKARHGTTYLKIDHRPSFEACMSSCAAMPACQSADYEARTKKCFYSTNTARPSISADAFVSAHSLGCAGACQGCKKNCDQLNGKALPADKPECNKNNGELVIAGGEDFRVYCGHCYRSHSSWNFAQATDLGSCAKACGEDPLCHGVNWIGDTTCSAHGAHDDAGNRPSFKPDSECNALAPQSRSIPAPY